MSVEFLSPAQKLRALNQIADGDRSPQQISVGTARRDWLVDRANHIAEALELLELVARSEAIDERDRCREGCRCVPCAAHRVIEALK